jgi:hypothetical protein
VGHKAPGMRRPTQSLGPMLRLGGFCPCLHACIHRCGSLPSTGREVAHCLYLVHVHCDCHQPETKAPTAVVLYNRCSSYSAVTPQHCVVSSLTSLTSKALAVTSLASPRHWRSFLWPLRHYQSYLSKARIPHNVPISNAMPAKCNACHAFKMLAS